MIWFAFFLISALVGFLTSLVFRLQSGLTEAQETNAQVSAQIAEQIEDLQSALVQRQGRRTHS